MSAGAGVQASSALLPQRLVMHDDPTPDLQRHLTLSAPRSEPISILQLRHRHRRPREAQPAVLPRTDRGSEGAVLGVSFRRVHLRRGGRNPTDDHPWRPRQGHDERTRGVRDLAGILTRELPADGGGRLHGIVAFVSRSKRAFTAESIALVQSVCHAVRSGHRSKRTAPCQDVGRAAADPHCGRYASLMAVVDGDLRYEYVNAAYERWFQDAGRTGRRQESRLNTRRKGVCDDPRLRWNAHFLGERVRLKQTSSNDTAGFRHIRAELHSAPGRQRPNARMLRFLVHDLT